MKRALIVTAPLAAVCFPYPPVLLVGVICSIAGAWAVRGTTPRFWVPACLTALLPFLLLVHLRDRDGEPPEPPDPIAFKALTRVDTWLNSAQLERLGEVLRSRSPSMDNSDTLDLLDGVTLDPRISLSILTLNLDPLSWRGRFFSNRYKDLKPGEPQFVVRDGRVLYVELSPLPSASEPYGYLAVEILFLTHHPAERELAAHSRIQPVWGDFMSVVVEPGRGDFLAECAELLEMPAPPFDVRFLREAANPIAMDLTAAGFALLLVIIFFALRRELGARAMIPVTVFALVLVGCSQTERLDHLTTFASYVFAGGRPGNLMASPFHLLLTLSLVFLLLQSLQSLFQENLPGAAYFPFVLLLPLVILGPDYFQSHNTFSYIHPLEAFQSPGAFLSHLGFISFFAYAGLLFSAAPPSPISHKAPMIGVAAMVGWWVVPEQAIAVVSVGLLWLLIDLRAPFFLRAVLLVLTFYPYMVLVEQRAELERVPHQILDEITLMGERNHFRMGRIIQRLDSLKAQLEEEPHAYMTTMFARESGLFEDQIDFALRLTDPGGRVISEVDQHISLEGFSYIPGPLNRIVYHREFSDDPNWLVFRTTLETSRGDFDLLAVLGNDFQNLSLIRNLRQVERDPGSHGDNGSNPYFAYLLDVFDLEGNPLYNQGDPEALSSEARTGLKQDPHFWYVEGRDTVFFFRDESYIYRVTHKATPARMVVVRFLALFLAVIFFMQLVRYVQRPGRTLISIWQRSFATKLAAFMFLSSVVPTGMLGYFLIQSIQKNQTREEQTIAQSKIKAARNLVTEYRRLDRSSDGGAPLEMLPVMNPADLPLQKFSRILGEDLSLYFSGSLFKTTQPEAFRVGLLNRRLPLELQKELLVNRKVHTLERRLMRDGGSMVVAYTPIRFGKREGVLAMTMIPYGQRQKHRWNEQLEFSLTLLFGLLFLMLETARFISKSYLRPVSAITRGAARMARGSYNRPIVIQRQDELQRMVQAFNTMQERVLAGRNQLQRQLGILDETLKSMSSGLLGFNIRGEIILENQPAWLLLGLEPEVDTLEGLVDQEPRLEILTRWFHDGHDGELTLHPPGGEREVIARLRRLAGGGGQDLAAILVVEDVTDAVAAGRFKAWSEMARRVAHEIKNPLTPIQLEIDYLAKMYDDRHPDFENALGEAVVEITSQVQHLRKIATEFSDYARPVVLERHETDLGRMVAELVEPYRKTLGEMEIQTFVSNGLMALVDERLIRRSLLNLVTNAIQAMEEAGRLTARVFADEQTFHIWIEDTGPGIPVEEHARVFQAYFSTKDQGTGLGLVIAKKYVDLHGGRLRIDPTYAEGTRFILDLPRVVEGEVEVDIDSPFT